MIHNRMERAVGSPDGDELQELRSQIDAFDDALLELIEKRFQKSLAIGQLKSEADPRLLFLRPEREEQVIRRLANRSKVLPRGAVSAIWREVMGASLQSQRRTPLALHAHVQPESVTSAARTRFGCIAPMIIVGSPADALRRAATGGAIAIIELTPLSSWWTGLGHSPDLRIFDALCDDGDSVAALAIGRVAEEAMASEAGDGPDFEILTDSALSRRAASGETLRILAFCGELRLCSSSRANAGGSATAHRASGVGA